MGLEKSLVCTSRVSERTESPRRDRLRKVKSKDKTSPGARVTDPPPARIFTLVGPANLALSGLGGVPETQPRRTSSHCRLSDTVAAERMRRGALPLLAISARTFFSVTRESRTKSISSDSVFSAAEKD